MIGCTRCGEAVPDDDFDPLCRGCREALWTELAARLVDSRAKALAAHYQWQAYYARLGQSRRAAS